MCHLYRKIIKPKSSSVKFIMQTVTDCVQDTLSFDYYNTHCRPAVHYYILHCVCMQPA